MVAKALKEVAILMRYESPRYKQHTPSARGRVPRNILIGRNLGSRTHTGGISFLLARSLYPLLIPVFSRAPSPRHSLCLSFWMLRHSRFQTEDLDETEIH